MLSQRRRHSRWRMCLILSAFLGLVSSGEPAPASAAESPPSSSSSSSTFHAKRKSQGIGSLSNDFTWQAWLLTDQHGSQSADSTLMRRITPKSVFIAPALPACPEGYTADNMDRCVKSVNIDENAHISFLLQRLNALYAHQELPVNNKSEQKKSTGPLQLNIPLIPNSQTVDFLKDEHEETFPIDDPIVIATRNETHPAEEEKKTTPPETEVTVYEVKNDTTLDDEETVLFLGNSSTADAVKPVKVADEKPDVVVSTAESVEETNDPDFADAVDYENPLDLKNLLNASSVKSDLAEDVTKNISTTEKAENSTEMPTTTLLLLISSAKPPSVNDLPLTQNDSADHVFAQMSNVTSNVTKEIIAVSVPDSALSSTKEPAEVASVAEDERRDNETHAEDDAAPEHSKPSESQEVDSLYDEEDGDAEYSYGTDVPDEEESLEAEGGEILKHGEAGMTIPTRNTERPHQQQQQHQNHTADREETFDTDEQIMIHLNDSAPTGDKEETDSNVSSEVSIDGDLILETTLLDVNTERLQATTKSPNVTRKIVRGSASDSKESYDKDPGSGSSKVEVVYSQSAKDATSSSLHGRKPDEHYRASVTRVGSKKNEKLEAAPSESLPHNSPEGKDPIAENKGIVEEPTSAKEGAPQKGPKDSQPDGPASGFRQTAVNLASAENYVRFPENYARQPAQPSDYVRFPVTAVNSVYGSNYKQHSHYPADEHYGAYGGGGNGGSGGGGGGGGGGGTGTKSSAPVRQKPVYYLAPLSWKPERAQAGADRAPPTAGERQKQGPLLRFWSKMPLVRDPAIYPADQTPDATAIGNNAREAPRDRFFPASSSSSSSSSRRISFPAETENVDRVLTQKRRTPISG